MNSELTQYLQDSWKAVIDADVDGPNAEPVKIDAGKPLFGQRSLTQRLARTVFFGAAPTIGSAHKGLETQRVFLGTATPGDVPGNFHSALAALADRATYFYSAGGKYWYDLQANISRRAKDQAERLHVEEVYKEIARATRGPGEDPRRRSPASTSAPRTRPTSPTSTRRAWSSCTPSCTHKRGVGDSDAIAFAKSATEHRGAANRTYRNMLVYLAGDRDRIEELERSVREYLGWSEILAKEDDLNLTTSQRNQATERQAKASETTDARLLGAYQWALVPTGQPIEIQATKVEGQATSLAERVSRRLGNDGALTVQHAAAGDPPPARHHRGEAVGGRARHRRRALAAVRRVPVHAAPARPRGARRGPHRARSCCGSRRASRSPTATTRRPGSTAALVLPTDGMTVAVTDATLIVRPERAKAQRAAEVPDRAPAATGAAAAGPEPGAGPQPPSPPSSRQDAVFRQQAPAGRPLRLGLQEARRRGARPARRRRPA